MSEYHTEVVTRTIVKKVAPFVPKIFNGSDLTKDEIEVFSRKEATLEGKSRYFDLASTIYVIGGVIIAILGVVLFLASAVIFQQFNLFQGLFYFIPFCFLLAGTIMYFKAISPNEKRKKFSSLNLLGVAIINALISYSVISFFIDNSII